MNAVLLVKKNKSGALRWPGPPRRLNQRSVNPPTLLRSTFITVCHGWLGTGSDGELHLCPFFLLESPKEGLGPGEADMHLLPLRRKPLSKGHGG